MLRNSFKFLSLALAVSLIVAPILAIDGNSNSSRLGLGLAVFGLVCIVAYNYFSGKNAPKPEPVAGQKPISSAIKNEAVNTQNNDVKQVNPDLKSDAINVVVPVVKNTQQNSERAAGALQIAEKAAGRFTENKIAVKSKVNFDAKQADEVKKPVEEPLEKSAMESEIAPAKLDETKDSEYTPGSYHMVTLDNLVLRHVEEGSKENKHFEQPNKITEARSTLKKTETNKIELKSRVGRTALGNNSLFARVAERNNKK